MKLSDYMARESLTASAFAIKAGVSIPTITRFLKGETLPRPATRVAIEGATLSEVKPRDIAQEFFDLSESGPSQRTDDRNTGERATDGESVE